MGYVIQKLLDNLEGEILYGKKQYSIPFVLPGDIVHFRVLRIKKGKRKLIPIKIEKQNSFLEKPECPYFGICGGCKGQHLPYSLQWKLKTDLLKKSYQDITNLKPVEIPSEILYQYRNRMDFVINGSIVGLRKPDQFDQFVDIEECKIQKKEANLVLKIFRKLIQQYPDIPYERSNKKGIIKYITIRIGTTGYIILTIIKENIIESYFNFINDFIKEIIKLEKEINYQFSLKECYIDEQSEISNVKEGKILYGSSIFRDRIGDLEIPIPPEAFFQPNPTIIEKILLEAITFLSDQKIFTEKKYHFMDLFCGTGSLSLFFFRYWNSYLLSIEGYEITENAIQVAKENFRSYLEKHSFYIPYGFYTFDLTKKISFMPKSNSILFLDPPRSGLHPHLIKWIFKYHSFFHWILYLSCNPKKQMEEIKTLLKYFQIEYLIWGDPFPHTSHWESLIILKNKNFR